MSAAIITMHMPSSVEGVSFLVISDTHDASFSAPNKHVEVLLHCGDLTEHGGVEAHRRAMEAIANFDAELKLVIPGNHDIDLDEQFTADAATRTSTTETTEARQSPDQARTHPVWHSDAAKSSNIHLLEEGTHTFTLESGVTFTVFASPITPTVFSSDSRTGAFQRPSREDRFNASGSPPWAENTSTSQSAIPDKIDIVMTHGPPKYVLDDIDMGANAGCEHLARAIARSRPLIHAFGHIHPGRGFQRVSWQSSPSNLSASRKRQHSQIDRDSNDDTGLPYTRLRKEFVGENSARRAGFARVNPVRVSDESRKTLFLNAAVGCIDGEAGHPPFYVEINNR